MRFLAETRAVSPSGETKTAAIRRQKQKQEQRQMQQPPQQQPPPQPQQQNQPQQPPQPQTQQPQFVGTADLAARWRYTPQGVNKLARSQGFPAPAFRLNAGRVRVWLLPEIQSFEADHPEVTSPVEKRRKIYGYFRAVSKGIQPEVSEHGE